MPGKLLTSLRNTVPTVSSTAGPKYAQDINDVLTGILDDLEPTVKPSEIDINADFDISGNTLLDVLTLQLNNQAATISGASNANRVYVTGGNLHFVNGSGIDVGITSGAALDSGSLGGFTNDYGLGDETARYTSSGSLYEFLSDTSPSDLHANVATGAVRIHETGVASSNRVTLTAPAGLAANYTWQYPASAAIAGISSTADLRINSSGVITVNETDTFGERTVQFVPATVIQSPRPSNWGSAINGRVAATGSSTNDASFGLTTRVGWRIKQVVVKVNKTSTGALNVKFWKYAATGVPVQVGSTQTTSLSGDQTLTVGSLTEVTVSGTFYFIEIEPPGSSEVSTVTAIEVTYDKV